MSYQFDSRIATCSSEEWMINSLGQSPCQVGTVLAYRACGWNQYYLGQLNPPDFAGYADVSAQEATACRCNTVTFMLVSACAICQGGENADWISYSRDCWGTVTQPSQGEYPGTLPSGIAVPAWAYWKSGRPNFQFSTAIAKDFAGPDSTRPGTSPSTSTTPPSSSSTSTTAGTTTTTASGTTTTTGTSTGTSDTTSSTGTSTTGTSSSTSSITSGTAGATVTGDGHDVAIPSDAPQQGGSGTTTTGGDAAGATSRSSNVGAIAGGVAGGVVALLLLGFLIFWLLRRRSKSKELHPEMSAVGNTATGGIGGAPGYSDGYDDSELPPDYATVYGESSAADLEGSTEGSSTPAAAPAPSNSRPGGSSTSKFPDPHAPLPPSNRIQSVHKSPLP